MTAPALPATQNGNNGGKTALAQSGPLATLQKYCQDPETHRRMKEMLGSRAGAFLNSIINVVKNNKQLQEIAVVNPASVMSSAMIAASVNLPIDPALGFAAIVPYAGREPAAQFQLMYKGLLQLAIRSGQYERIHDTEVYKDEIESYNPITGETKFTDPATWRMRAEGKVQDVAGFYTYFRLKTGFEASKYISFDQAMAHGKRFSKSFQADMKYNKGTSLWSTDPIAMGRKTCIKMLIGKYGILSIEMQDAFVAESEDFAGDARHVDSSVVVEDPAVGGVDGLKARMLAEQPQAEPSAEPQPEPAGAEPAAGESELPAWDPETPPEQAGPQQTDQPQDKPICQCIKCGAPFPVQIAKGVPCAACGSTLGYKKAK